MRTKTFRLILNPVFVAAAFIFGCGSPPSESLPSKSGDKGVIARDIEIAEALEDQRAERDQGFEGYNDE
ncbi:MAG: hypothetical protein IH851_13970 [Armatimonadetes bacterium]|nr:hypothetical protein [Armatimonadota bacterium]